jgi:hypothetical protein
MIFIGAAPPLLQTFDQNQSDHGDGSEHFGCE